MVKNYIKMLRNEFSGYNASKLIKDLLAGLTVAAVALPLALAFGVASGANAAAGLITAIIAGIVISALSGASFQISGPTGAMSAVLITIATNEAIGLNGVFLVCIIAGIILLVCGIFRLGKLVSLIPRPVITGFTSGIAVIIALGQIDNFFGTVSEGSSAIDKLISYGSLGFKPHLWTLLLGLIVVVIMIVWPKKWNAKVPSSLIGIIVSTVIYVIFRFDGVATVGEIPKTLFLEDRLSFAGLNLDMLTALLPSAITVAALGMIESLLCGASASRMKNEPFDANIELIAQGAGNILIPFFGGVPATAAIARTSVAIKSGAQTRLTGIFHALWLLAAMFLLGSVMALVPMSALGGVLIVTAWRMNEWHAIKYMFKKKFVGAILQFLITMLATVIFDLTIAIIIGIVFSLMVFVKNAAHLEVTSAKVEASRLAPRGELGNGHDDSAVVYVTGDLFFANIGKLSGILTECGEKEVLVSLRGVPDIDISSVETLEEWCREMRADGRRVIFCGMNSKVEAVLRRSGMYEEFGDECFFASIDKALMADVE
ncbi:MAG: SulP family inorganic anion transporter [Clostridia bacterium]|nr:SulP family inorganic anion transporter [Clostridia bacterium]MBQ8552482.1 SulP family inorganic anion transporter [Clostridia bacterium]